MTVFSPACLVRKTNDHDSSSFKKAHISMHPRLIIATGLTSCGVYTTTDNTTSITKNDSSTISRMLMFETSSTIPTKQADDYQTLEMVTQCEADTAEKSECVDYYGTTG